jgi:membrane fusion protein, copper/silver efflux system
MSEEIHLYDPHEHEPMPEGEEQAPPYVRTMAIIRWIILGGMTLFAAVMILNYFGATPWSEASGGPIQYHCPMHPTYVSNQPGDCPICGMTLVPIDASGKETNAVKDTATTVATSDEKAVPKAKPGQYTCPMDPEVISDQPGRCPVCGMKLVQVPPTTDSVATPNVGDMTQSNMGPAPVPGLVPITIEPQRLQLTGLRTGTVSVRPLEGSLRLVGFVTPDESRLSDIQLRFSGWVKQLTVDQTGQQIKAGQKLLSIYSPDIFQAEQDYIVAKQSIGRVGDAELSATRQQLLTAAHQRLELLGVPKEELSRLDSANAPASEIWIRSPSTGVVLEKNVIEGQQINPNQSLFSVADLSRVWVLADVYERDLAGIKLGQNVKMTSNSYPGELFEGTVSFIYPTVSEQSRTLKIRIEFANPSLRLKPGMYAEVEIEGEGTGVLAVPADAVMDGGSHQYAFVVHGGTHFEPRMLKIGRRADDYMEVLSGLSEGDEVVTSASFLIDSESRLKAAISGMGGTDTSVHAGHGK